MWLCVYLCICVCARVCVVACAHMYFCVCILISCNYLTGFGAASAEKQANKCAAGALQCAKLCETTGVRQASNYSQHCVLSFELRHDRHSV
jgi:hypothetical protein